MKLSRVGSDWAKTGLAQVASRCPTFYMLLALPLSLFFYLETTPEAQSFFAGYSDAGRGRILILGTSLAVLAGTVMLWRLPLRGKKAIGLLWAGLIAGLGLAFRDDSAAWDLAAAYALCVPGWIGLSVWIRQIWHSRDQPVGPVQVWAGNGLLLASAVVLCFAANATCMSLVFPQLNSSAGIRLLLASRVGALAGAVVLALWPGILALRNICEVKEWGMRPMLFVIGLLLEGAAMMILLNGLRFIGGIFVGFSSGFYIFGLTSPAVALFCGRAASRGEDLGEALSSYGRPTWWMASNRYWIIVPWFALLVLTLWVSGCAHLYYEWGFATATFYSALSVGAVWFLLTMLPQRAKSALAAFCLFTMALGATTFLPTWQTGLPWNTYLKFDKNFGSLVNAYHRHYPKNEAAFREARQLLEASHSDEPLDLTQVRRQELVLHPRSRRPNVFFIVADALRGETYGASAAQCRLYPGVEWMTSRFAIYDNAWTSYNSTRGSYPAYLNGRMQPAWYEYFWSYPVRQDNILSRACALAGYGCYNFASFSDDFRPYWPTNTWQPIHPGGEGLGDPGVVFPQALETLDAHQAETPGQPAFFYLHLFNMHQPLCRRPGIPLHSRGLYFMRALYEQNVAYFDLQLLAFLRGLEQRGLLENSMIVVCADHGEELFDMGGVYHGWQINPWVMHVPLFVHYPVCVSATAPPPEVLSRPVNLIDLAPAICQAMGVEIVRNSPLQGVSLLEPEPAEPRTFLLLSWKNPVVGEMSFRHVECACSISTPARSKRMCRQHRDGFCRTVLRRRNCSPANLTAVSVICSITGRCRRRTIGRERVSQAAAITPTTVPIAPRPPPTKTNGSRAG